MSLFAEMYDSHHAIPTDEQIRLFLRNKAGADIGQVKEIAVHLSKLFKKVSRYLITEDDAEKPSGGDNMKEEESTTPTVGLETYMLGNGVQIKLPKEDASIAWDKAKRALDIILGVEPNSSNHIKGKKDSSETT